MKNEISVCCFQKNKGATDTCDACFVRGTLETLSSSFETKLTSNDYSSNTALVYLWSISGLFRNYVVVFCIFRSLFMFFSGWKTTYTPVAPLTHRLPLCRLTYHKRNEGTKRRKIKTHSALYLVKRCVVNSKKINGEKQTYALSVLTVGSTLLF